MQNSSENQGLHHLVEAFLKELRVANRSDHTLRAYRTDLHQLAAFHPDSIGLKVTVARYGATLLRDSNYHAG